MVCVHHVIVLGNITTNDPLQWFHLCLIIHFENLPGGRTVMEFIICLPAERRRNWCDLNTSSSSLLNIISSQLPFLCVEVVCLTLHVSGTGKGVAIYRKVEYPWSDSLPC
jgi:hypothetical protein